MSIRQAEILTERIYEILGAPDPKTPEWEVFTTVATRCWHTPARRKLILDNNHPDLVADLVRSIAAEVIVEVENIRNHQPPSTVSNDELEAWLSGPAYEGPQYLRRP